MTDGDQPEQLQSVAGQQDGRLPELTTCAKCGARLSEILPSCPTCGEGVARERRGTAAPIPPMMTVDASPVFTVRYMILQKLAETNQPTYANALSQSLAQYGIKRERILIELNKLINSKYGLVKRMKASYPFQKRFLYSITENGVNELKKKKGIAFTRKESVIETPPLDPYLWLLENLAEPRTFTELQRVRGDSEKTLSVYLSTLYKLGVIDRYKQAETKQFSQRNRIGRIVERTTTVMRTYYQLRPGPLREKLAETSMLPNAPQTVKIEMPLGPGLKEPALDIQQEEEYSRWRQELEGKPEFIKAVIAHANRAKVSPKTMFRIAFVNLKKAGKL